MNDTAPKRPELAAANERFCAALADMQTIANSAGRLRATIALEEAAQADIAALDAIEAEAIRAWARSGEGPQPQCDAKRRGDLTRKLVQYQAQANAARGALPLLVADHEAVAKVVAASSAAKRVHVAKAIHDEGFALLPEAESRFVALMETLNTVAIASQLVLIERAHAENDVPWSFDASELARSLQDIMSRLRGRPSEADAQHLNARADQVRKALKSFAERLHSDPEATFSTEQENA